MFPSIFSKLRMLVDGVWIDNAGGGWEPVINPATGEMLGRLPHANRELLGSAVAAARCGLERWRATSAAEKSAVLLRAADVLAENMEQNSLVMTLEQGKPLAESRGEWERVIDTLKWHAQAIGQLRDISYTTDFSAHTVYSRLEPIGVCVGLTAWNFPALLPARKLAPVLAAGCSMILKASEEAPASAILLLEALQEGGLPNGVANLVFGVPANVSDYLLRDPVVRKCSFTGSIAVGKHIAGIAAEGLKNCTFELGGHAPVIVLGDADVSQAVEKTGPFKFRNAGQACISPSRFYIAKEVYSEFLQGFVEYVRRIKVGNGTETTTTMGPLANSRRLLAVQELCRDAVDRGAELVIGGSGYGHDSKTKGFYWQPTVLANVPNDAALMNTEPFGPIVAINPFSDLEEVLAAANGLQYGLASYLFTQSRERAKKIIERVEAGGIVVNDVAVMQPDVPFGGIKESGSGYEGGMEGITSFLHKKLVISHFAA